MASRRHVLRCCILLLVAGGCSEAHREPGDVGPPLPVDCPDEMVRVPDQDFCIDRYEGLIDAEGRVRSEAGVIPTADIGWLDARDACTASGKVLCPEEVWTSACTAGGTRIFPYGDDFDQAACNVHSDGLVPTGSMESCEGGLPDLFDMVGNVCEYVDHCVGTDFCFCGGEVYTANGDSGCGPPVLTPYGRGSGLVGAGVRCCLRIQPDEG